MVLEVYLSRTPKMRPSEDTEDNAALYKLNTTSYPQWVLDCLIFLRDNWMGLVLGRKVSEPCYIGWFDFPGFNVVKPFISHLRITHSCLSSRLLYA